MSIAARPKTPRPAAWLGIGLVCCACQVDRPADPVRTTAASSDTVALYDIADVVLSANQRFDATAGEINPFDIEIRATVRAPDGRTFEVPGFFDGDGGAGLAGDVFRVRVFADLEGTWSWRTRSELAALDRRVGTFECAGPPHLGFARGPVVTSPHNPRAFAYRDGSPVYLVGKFLDLAAPPRLRWVQAFLSEHLTDEDRAAILDRHLSMRVNYLNIHLANGPANYGLATTPWVGTFARNDKTRFDLTRWRGYETWVGRLAEAGLVAQLWFLSDDSGYGEIPAEDLERFFSYGMARLSAYVNTMVVVMLEWQEGWTREEVRSFGRHVQARNPWGRLISVHGTTGDFEFPEDDWVDFMSLQPGNDTPYRQVYEATRRNREFAAKPLLAEEFALGEETDENRRRSWSALMAGAAGSGTGAYLQWLSLFVRDVPHHTLRPAPELVRQGLAYALADPGRSAVVYLPEGGEIELALADWADPVAAEWYDPRTGERSERWRVDREATRHIRAPDERDWVLRLYSEDGR